MRLSTISKLLICGLMCCSCTLEEVLDYGSTCEASYVLTSNGKCVAGECGAYEVYFEHKRCPQVAPLCIEDEEGAIYCGAQCPKRQHKVVPAKENGTECEADSKLECGDEKVNCLSGSEHEGWVDALCNAHHECEATLCQDTFYFTGDNCLTKAQCCGQFCQDCTRKQGKVCSGMDKSAVCVDSCKENEFVCGGSCIDPMTSNTYCGSTGCNIHQCDRTQTCMDGKCTCLDEGMVICEDGGACIDILTNVDNCGECGNKCSESNGWREGECKEGTCVPDICAQGYHLGMVDEKLQCVQDSVDACGSEDYSCKLNVEHWASGQCDMGHCVLEECTDGLVAFDNACVKPGDICGNTTCKANEFCDDTNTCQCIEGYKACDGSCYDVSQSKTHCGSCGHSCNVEFADNSCEAGECVFSCIEGYVSKDKKTCQVRNCEDQAYMCDGLDYKQCIEDEWAKIKTCTTDIDNAVPVCDVKSGCDYRCTDNYSMCDDKLCYNLKTDINHCGNCSTSCNVKNATNRCDNGVCHFDCDPGFVVSKDGTACVPFVCTTGAKRCDGLTPQTCQDNEWKSQSTCSTNIANATATCNNKDLSCGFKCNSGYTECGGQCVDLKTSTSNCGSCGKVCNEANANNSCSNATCSYTCKSGYDKTSSGCVKHVCNAGDKQCNGNSVQTCQNNAWVTTTTCPAPSNGAASCSNAVCSFTCNTGYDKIGSGCVKHVCNAGAKQCGSGNVQTCQNNAWVTTQTCSAPSNATASCNNAQCGWSCKSGYFKCSSSCYGAVMNGMATDNATTYTSPGSGASGSVSLYSNYKIYWKYDNYFAINNGGNLRYVDSSSFAPLPITGRITSTNGVNVRADASASSAKVNADKNGICWGCEVTIDSYKYGTPNNGYGWFHITSNTGGTGPYTGYVSAQYVEFLRAASSSSLSTCR